MWRNPRVVLGTILLGLLCVSLGIEQGTRGEYATPPILGDILKVAITAFFAAGGLAEILRLIAPQRGVDRKRDESNDEPQ